MILLNKTDIPVNQTDIPVSQTDEKQTPFIVYKNPNIESKYGNEHIFNIDGEKVIIQGSIIGLKGVKNIIVSEYDNATRTIAYNGSFSISVTLDPTGDRRKLHLTAKGENGESIEEDIYIDNWDWAERTGNVPKDDQSNTENTGSSSASYFIVKNDVEEVLDQLIPIFTVKDIEINDHLGTTDPNDKIVLIRLSYDREDSINKIKQTINMYNNTIGAKLADINEIQEVTIFWEVPNISPGVNLAKANLQRNGKKMYFHTDWFDPILIWNE